MTPTSGREEAGRHGYFQDDDFAKAKKHLGAILKEWHMVHNIADGLPVESITTLKELETANQSINFGFIGLKGFSDRVFSLEPHQVETLLGPAATDADASNLDIAALRDLVQHLRTQAEANDFDPQDLQPVPPEKLKYCRRRFKSEPPRRSNIEPGVEADFEIVGCG